MKRARLLLFALSVLCAAQTVAGEFPYATTDPRALTFAPLHFDPPQPHIEKTANGITVFLLEDHELPLFSATAYFKAGTIYEPSDKLGLAGLTGTVMRTGGAGERTGDQIDELIEFLAGSVESSIGEEYGTVRVSVLKKDLAQGMELFADVIRRPLFAPDKLELAKAQAREGILRRNDDPGSIAGREFARLVYGHDSPWARQTELYHLARIRRQDLVAFHRRYFHPNNMLLAVSGDITRDQLMREVQRRFGDWPQEEIDFPTIQPVKPPKPGAWFIEKDVKQAVIRMGHLGRRRHDPDQYSLSLMNFILGSSGFTSRLMRRVRSDRGLAYSVWSVLSAGTDRGLFRAGADTKLESTGECIQLMKETIASMTQQPVTEEELSVAKQSNINSFVFDFVSSQQIVSRKAYYRMFGYPDDFLEKYPDHIRDVTAADILAAARKHVHPDRMVLLVLGVKECARQIPKEFGVVNRLQLTDPAHVKPPAG